MNLNLLILYANIYVMNATVAFNWLYNQAGQPLSISKSLDKSLQSPAAETVIFTFGYGGVTEGLMKAIIESPRKCIYTQNVAHDSWRFMNFVYGALC